MQIMIPPLDSQWRLKDDWQVPLSFFDRYDNAEIKKNFGLDYLDAHEWPEYKNSLSGNESYHAYSWWDQDPGRRERFAEWKKEKVKDNPPMFPKGTVIVFDRYHASHSGDHAITVRVLTSPNLLITPKKMGGKGKGKMRCYFHINELNSMPEIEPCELPKQP